MKAYNFVWLLLAMMAFSFQSFAQEPIPAQATDRIAVCIGEFTTEGLEVDASWAAVNQIQEALASLQVVVLVQPDKAMLATGRLDTKACNQRVSKEEGPTAILNIHLTRFGPFMRVNLSTIDPTNNAVLWQKEIKTGTDSPLADALKNDLNLGLQKISERFPSKVKAVFQTPEGKSQPIIPEAKTTEPTEQKPVAEDKGKFKVTGVYGRVQAKPSNAKKTWGWVAIGVGGAMVVTGGVIWGATLKWDQNTQDRCKNGELDEAGCNARSSLVKGQARWGDGLLIPGVAIAATGILLLTVFADKDDPKSQSSISFQPTVGPDGVGAVVQGRF